MMRYAACPEDIDDFHAYMELMKADSTLAWSDLVGLYGEAVTWLQMQMIEVVSR